MSQMKLLLEDLLEKIQGTKISEIEVTLGDLTLGVKRRSSAAANPPAAAAVPETSVAPSNTVSVDSPIAGVFYASPSPTEPAYVNVGDHINAGQVVGLVEAMKVFNEVLSAHAGSVVSVVDTGTEVQKGAALVEIDPD
ncbi:MAG: acetyl-CoA carboxylase, biotin carboxyl carrier protein [Chloroflexi bacterium]|nr:acetyl-CoA carboxylase, biotin carboxyl carrier protein [Chloroflexota bacterium]MXY13630.1 acetyl-CoA carboxylase, biotin carboxyl carrier protein [Chloroflexota bacterium]